MTSRPEAAMPTHFPVRPFRGQVILYDDQEPEAVVGGVVVCKTFGCAHLDFLVAAVHPDDRLDFGVGSRVVLDDPNVAGDANHRRRLNGVVYRAVPVEHVIGVLCPEEDVQ